MRTEMLHHIHYSHLGAEACLRKAREVLFWPGMAHAVRDFIALCGPCNQLQPEQPKEPMMTHEIPTQPWSRLAADLFEESNTHYLIIVDYFSDFWELTALRDESAYSVIVACKEQFARYGIPRRFISDNGPQFTSHAFQEFAKDWEFTHVVSSPYNSRSNGKAESAVKIAKTLIRKARLGKQDLWKAILDWRNTPTKGMTSSPTQRLLNRRVQSILPVDNHLLQPQTISGVPEDIARKRQQAKIYYDRAARELPQLAVGDWVRVRSLPRTSSGDWKLGKCVYQDAPRSYIVNIDGRLFRRNRQFLRPTSEPIHQEESTSRIPAISNQVDQNCSVREMVSSDRESQIDSDVPASNSGNHSPDDAPPANGNDSVDTTAQHQGCADILKTAESSDLASAQSALSPVRRTRTRIIHTPARYKS